MRHLIAVTLILALAAPSLALDENPDGPVGLVGLEVYANRAIWRDSELTIATGFSTTIIPNETVEQTVIVGGANLIVPVVPRVTVRVGVARLSSKWIDRRVAQPSGSIVALKETMNGWGMEGSVTFWLGSPSRK